MEIPATHQLTLTIGITQGDSGLWRAHVDVAPEAAYDLAPIQGPYRLTRAAAEADAHCFAELFMDSHNDAIIVPLGTIH